VSAERIATGPLDPCGCAFYTVADSRFYLGTVALVNSLRLTGHAEPIFVADAGLTQEQRSSLASHVTLVPAPPQAPAVFLKMLGPLTHPAEVGVLLDADVIVTKHLGDLVELTREGRLVAFQNNEPNHARFFADWSHTLALGPLRRQPYLAAGQLFVPDELGRRLFRPWMEGQAKIDLNQTWLGKGKLSDPFYFADMDVFNAVVAAHLDPHEILALEHRFAPHPPFADLRLIDETRLLVQYDDGARPYLLHHVLAKPWLKATPTNLYSRLLTRLLFASDVALRLDSKQVPLRLRRGWLAAADRERANVQALVMNRTRVHVGKLRLRTRLGPRDGRR
jgi:hypothetical protein